MNVRPSLQRLHLPWMAWWLACALVLGPAMGRMHEVLHVPGSGDHRSAQTQSEHAHGIAALFDGHHALQCLVLDQLGHTHGPCGLQAAIAHSLPDSPPIGRLADGYAPAVNTMFLARAPPERFMA